MQFLFFRSNKVITVCFKSALHLNLESLFWCEFNVSYKMSIPVKI